MEVTDASLVTESLTGNRDAFGRIVARYQTLICSLAYSATGSMSQSQDLAQETFIIAWKKLRDLREPEKLRAWLCAILKNRVYKAFRSDGREPAHAAEALESAPELPSREPPPSEQAISREEESILWRSIEQIPEAYREPLILFYREHQSIETVAQNLELSEDAVKQRLSRGRKLLQEQVQAFVEDALRRTNPGKAFTLAVLAALPALTISAKAATLGAAAAKGSMTAKAATIGGAMGGLLSIALGFFGMWSGYRASIEASRTEREVQFNKRFFKRLGACIGGFFVVYLVLMFSGSSILKAHPALFGGLMIGLALVYLVAIAFYSAWCYRERKKLIASLTATEIATNPTLAVWEYRSRFRLLGLPFIHMRIGDRLGQPIKAWIAIGDCALGILFAFGGCAIAPVCVGGCAVGLISYGGCAIGVLALGGLGIGVWVFGGLAVGWQAFGACAVAWNAAWGGYAVAHHFALGETASALQANSDSVQQILMTNPFFRTATKAMPYLFWLNLIWILPLIIQRQVVKRASRRSLS